MSQVESRQRDVAPGLDESELARKLTGLRPAVQDAIIVYVRRAAAEFPGEIVSITLYGSQVRREAGVESDIDLFIVVLDDRPALREALVDLAWQVQFQYDVVISDVIRSEDQLRRMKAQQFPYYQNVESEGLLLWKNASEPMPSYA